MDLGALLCVHGPLKWSLVTPEPRGSPGFFCTLLPMLGSCSLTVYQVPGFRMLTTPTLALQDTPVLIGQALRGEVRCPRLYHHASLNRFSSFDTLTVPGTLGPMSTRDPTIEDSLGYAHILILEAA